MNFSKPQEFTTSLASIEKVGNKVYLERFALVEPTEINFIAGQTVMLKIGPGINRSMSIASPPSEKTSILVAHNVGPRGPYSQWTIQAKVGDTMHFVGPLGAFVLDRESPRKKVLVATGTGIAPFHSMLPDFFSEVSLYWGLRFVEDIFWEEEFRQLTAANPKFNFHLVLSKPSADWQGLTGHVTEHVLNKEKDLANTDFYLCGGKGIVSDVKKQLLTQNVPEGQIKTEPFY